MEKQKVNCFDMKGVKQCKVYVLSDLHLGAKINFSLAKQLVNCVNKQKYALLLCNGDLLEFPDKNVGDSVYNYVKNPQSALDMLYDLLEPVKDKIIGMHQGNHEQRIMKKNGIDITHMLAKQLGVPYLKYSAYTKIIVNGIPYIIWSTHGNSGAKKPLSKMRVIENLSYQHDADVYIMGHVHAANARKFNYGYVNSKNEACVKHKYLVLAGHFLTYKDSYADMMNLLEEGNSYPVITLRGDKKEVMVNFTEG